MRIFRYNPENPFRLCCRSVYIDSQHLAKKDAWILRAFRPGTAAIAAAAAGNERPHRPTRAADRSSPIDTALSLASDDKAAKLNRTDRRQPQARP